MAKLNVTNDMSEQFEYNSPSLPIRSMTCELADFSGQTSECHWHDDLEFLLVLKGSMYYIVEDRQYLLTPGMGIFVNSGRLHYGKVVGEEGCFHDFLLLGLPMLRKYEYLEQKYIQPLLSEESADAIVLSPRVRWQRQSLELIEESIRLFRSGQEGYELLLTGVLDRLILLLHSNLPAKEARKVPASRENSMKRMIGYIKKNYPDKLKLDDIAAAGAVCRSRCCQLFKSVLDQSPIEYLTDFRLEKSCEMLREGTVSVTDVAQGCGFGSSSYFGSLFRKKYGVTPREYQSRYIGK